MPSIRRRTLLGAVASGTVAGLAGCSSSCPDTDPPDPAAVVRPDDDDAGFRSVPSGAWPTPRFDAANTGFAPSRRVPTGTPSLGWLTSVPAPSVEGSVANASAPTVADGHVYLTTGAGTFALSLRDGTERWRNGDVRPASAGADGAPTAPVVGERFVYVSATDGVAAMRPADGSVAWRHTETRPTGTLAVADGALFVPTAGGVRALDARDGTHRWGTGLDSGDDDGGTTAQPAVADGAVVVTGDRLVALEAATGDRRWSVSTPTDGRPVVADGTVFLGTDGGVVGRRLDDGSERWSMDRGDGRTFTAPVVTPETVYAVERPGEATDATFALDRGGDGPPEPRWCSSVGDGVVTAAATDHAFAVQSSGSNQPQSVGLVAFTERFGEATWGYAAADRPVAPAVLDGGVVIVNRRGTVAALGGG